MNKATRIFTSAFGALMALAGIEHGIGEVLQGNVRPEGVMIQSWPGSAHFESLGGEPAMTIVPNLLITGILAIFFSLILLVWAVWFVPRRNGGWVMILLSVPVLLFGGGIFPPILAMLVGLVGTRINAPLTWWRNRVSASFRRTLGKLWPWLLAVSLAAWLIMFSGLKDSTVILVVLSLAFFPFLLAIPASFARDSSR